MFNHALQHASVAMLKCVVAKLSRLMNLNNLVCGFGLVKDSNLCSSSLRNSPFNTSLGLHGTWHSKQGGSFMLADATQQRPFKLSVIDLNITSLLEFLDKSESFVFLYRLMATFFLQQ